MIGIDIVKIDRITSVKSKFESKFIDKFLLPSEVSLVKNDANLAGIWAAKEAASKALGCGIGAELSFLDVEIYKDKKGAPKLKFNENIVKKFNIKNTSLSITHDGGFAIAAVIVEN
ncbi:holo-ACP synthase [Campylobacter fetus]|uniref:Holo-[acyl-carrier-protein] synthase n=1 Tax=Campylobacter fetus subsp. testudinum TaxID=1507806 RepID=A0AAX0HBR5_CAMFE|nr:holo-ACP synthase [Campylobacter fetus]AGZ81779.1 holo-(acyl-carrier-protein) synthase [Campylobacter fetus subsp. testudinum 03-427]AJB45511.1 4'-phosphopantetheinyl transferase [Campylobacter fetus subsp. testudinum]ALV64935.1 holo-(acyl-carrier-protein) synthase [Campylobacter fetus subsp. testudinum Sp3]AVK81181.1 holo-ACP synthase [Campylobacter fetus subsp. testudinum]EAI4321245.1 holo-ACP synthase [Campylobacter fetus]